MNQVPESLDSADHGGHAAVAVDLKLEYIADCIVRCTTETAFSNTPPQE